MTRLREAMKRPEWIKSAEVLERIDNYLQSGTAFVYVQAPLQPVAEAEPAAP